MEGMSYCSQSIDRSVSHDFALLVLFHSTGRLCDTLHPIYRLALVTKVFVGVHHDVKRSIVCVSTYENSSCESDVQVLQAEGWHLLLLFKK